MEQFSINCPISHDSFLKMSNIAIFVSDIDHLTGENFFESLDNGSVVCRLARVIQEKARSAIDAGKAKGVSKVI